MFNIIAGGFFQHQRGIGIVGLDPSQDRGQVQSALSKGRLNWLSSVCQEAVLHVEHLNVSGEGIQAFVKDHQVIPLIVRIHEVIKVKDHLCPSPNHPSGPGKGIHVPADMPGAALHGNGASAIGGHIAQAGKCADDALKTYKWCKNCGCTA